MGSIHINANDGAFAETVLFPGDPLRAKYIAEKFFTDAEQVTDVRNILGYTGNYEGKRISVMGSGMGIPSASIYAKELITEYGVKEIVRIGSCGAVSKNVQLRDVVIGMGASTDSNVNRIRFGGYDYAAIADFGLMEKAVAAARAMGLAVKVGNIFSADLFYTPDTAMFDIMEQYDILGVEMEAAGVYSTAVEYGAKALAICTVTDHIRTGAALSSEERQLSLDEMITMALESHNILITRKGMVMKDKIQNWLARDPDARMREELQSLIDASDQDELSKRFSGRLEFGTAGLRGVVGAGPGMMNRLVIRETSAGLGGYLLREVPGATQRGVIVAYDGRLDSRQFARDAACVFAGMGITAYLTPDVAATPVAAFGVIHLGTAAGVVVTASHNPPQYNGYKVYWSNGAQIIPPHDAGIAASIDEAARQNIPWLEFDQGVADGKIVVLGAEFYRSYIDTIQSSPLYHADGNTRAVSIAYTAMHGVGANIAETLLGEAGFESVYSVSSQREPDGSFPTVNFPNPEEPGAMDAVVALARENNATLACANDPDADRLAVAVRTDAGDYQMLTGDQLGILLANYLLEKKHDFVPIVCTTIVSSSMLEHVAIAAGAQYHTTLTGFKWLTNVALASETQDESGRSQFLFAYEEALGYAPGRQVRDKDGLSALLAFAQMTEALVREGKSVLDQLESLYRRHGIYLTSQRSIALVPGAQPIGDLLRQQAPETIAGTPVVSVDDLGSGNRTHADGTLEPLAFPRSDVLIYRLENRSRVIVRPSGTEPKVKCYYEVVQDIGSEDFYKARQKAETALADLISAHQSALAELTTG